MGDVASHDDGALQAYARADRIFRQFGTHSIDALVEVDFDALRAFARLAVFLRDEFRRIGVHLFNPDTIFVNLRLDVAVGRATNAHADGAACTVARQTYDADVVCQIFTAKLCAEADFVCLLEQFFFEVDVAEGASRFVARCWQAVVVFDRGELHRQKVLFSARSADDKSDVVWRAGSRSEALHLFNEERQQCAFVLDGGLRHGVEVSLVGRTATLGNHHEAVFVAFSGFDVNLCREVAARVHLVVHVERSVL